MVACCSFGVCERRERQPGKSAPPCLLGFVVVEGLWVSFGVLSSVVRGRRDERNRTVCVLGLLVAGVMAAVPAAGETERERSDVRRGGGNCLFTRSTIKENRSRPHHPPLRKCC